MSRQAAQTVLTKTCNLNKPSMFGITARAIAPNLRGSQMFLRCLSSRAYEPPKIEGLNSEKWLEMKNDVKEEIIEYLDWKMGDDWKQLSPVDKKASYFVSYGEWGPRAKPGSKAAQMQLSGAEIILRGVFSGILFTAVAVSVINYQTDRKVQESLEKLEREAPDGKQDYKSLT